MSSPSDNEYYDDVEEEFTTPSRSGENSDHLDWESDQERFSFENPPADLQEQLGGVHDWPPRLLSSETDYNFLEERLLPDPELDTVNEDTLREVFEESEDSEGEMPARAQPTEQESYDIVKRGLKTWESTVARIKRRGAPVPPGTVEDLKNKKEDFEEKANDFFEAFQNPETSQYKGVIDILDKIGDDMDDVRRLLPAADPATAADKDEEKEVEKLIKKLEAKLSLDTETIVKVKEEVNTLINQLPTPTDASMASVKCHLEAAKKCQAMAQDTYRSIVAELSGFSNPDKQGRARTKNDNMIATFDHQAAQVRKSIEDYMEKNKSPNPKSSIPLERLPLPKFSGRKIDYSRFKLDFAKHVNYDTEEEKLLALKERCLTNKADKDRVQNQNSLKDCWRVLDAEHGDTETTVCDIFKQWKNLKSPQNDKQFVEFMNQIENGVSCLEALNSAKELTASAVVNIEEKLNKDFKEKLSLAIIKKKSTESRMSVVMDLLKDEKAAAQLRISNYSSNSHNDDKSPGKTGSHFSSTRGGGGGGRGKGKPPRGRGNYNNKNHHNSSGRGRGRGGTRGRGGKRASTGNNCLLCSEQHYLPNCPKWQDRSTDKFHLLGFCTANNICTWCLKKGHRSESCYNEEDLGCPCGSENNTQWVCCDTEECRERSNWDESVNSNNSVITDTEKAEVVKENDTACSNSSGVIVNGVKMGEAILPIQLVKVEGNNMELNTMFDNCSQNTFILDEAAQQLRLRNRNISFILVCTNGQKTKMRSRLYELTLIDVNGDHHSIQAIGLPELSSKYSGFNVINIKHDLQGMPECEELNEDKLSRAGGEIQLLVGSDVASLHPRQVGAVGDLVILLSLFGTGGCVMGHNHKHINMLDNHLGTRVQVSKAEDITEINCNLTGTKDLQFLECIATESLGVNVTAKCKSCKIRSENCEECRMISKTTSYLEYLQDNQIEEKIEKIPNAPGYVASYPYNSDIDELQTNERICMKRAETIETNMKKNPGDMKKLNEVVQESFDKGTFRYLSEEEVKNWTGRVHYVPMSVTYRPESESTTPVRIIFDSGQPDKNGRSLNTCMSKGKNPINHFGSVILSFRAAEQVACGDIRKMFHQIAVRDIDMHLRRFFWRPDGLGGSEPWRIAVPTSVNFGETAAPTIATKVKNRAAEDYKHISEDVSKMIIRDCIMDDINIKAKYTENIDDNIKKAEEILSNGKFTFKKWTKSGDKGEKSFEKEDSVSRSLGLWWKTEKDLLTYKIKLNFSKKKRNRYLLPDTTAETLEKDFPPKMSKRLALKLNHSVFDPANLLQPWSLKLRLAYRDILFYERENEYSDWDKMLPDKFRDQWLDLTREMFQLETLEFPRSLVPRDYDNKMLPTLTLFSDGADLGICAVAYLVWKLKDETIHVSLVTSRTKIASLTKQSTPRMELCASQLQTRLRVWIQEEMDIEVGEVLHIVDASIILGMIKNVSLKFETFTAPRITEIQTNTKVEEWHWTDTKSNSSDIGTRGKCSIEDLGPGKLWREGPDWLKEPRHSWPLRSDFKKHQVPGLKKEFEVLPPSITHLSQLVALNDQLPVEEEPLNVIQVHNTDTKTSVKIDYPDVTKIVDPDRYNSWLKLLRVSANVLKVILKLRKIKPPSQVELIKIVKHSWLLSMMPKTREMLKVSKLPGFIIHESDNIVYATTRVKQENLNPDKLIILNPKHPLTKMILFDFHNINHCGVQQTVAKSRIYFWIPQAAKIVKSIKSKCFHCRAQDAKAMSQLMSPLPDIRLKPSSVWAYTMVDIFGPIKVRDFVNQKSERKTWGVLFTCLLARACWAYLSESYSTDHFLSVMKKHEARNGSAIEYHADLGSQIVGADKAMTEAIKNIDTDKIEQFAANRNSKFVFGTAHFPEGQGAAERLIQEIKKNLKVITKYKSLSFGELDCLLSEASYLVNSRPLQPNPTSGDDGYICPNDILFGRSDREPPSHVDINDTSLTRRAAHKQKIIAEFWDKWSSSYYQSLIKFSKWKNPARNAEVKDMVLILDKEFSKGKFAVGVIDSVKKDQDGKVRKVVVKYKVRSKKHTKHFKYTERNVRGLALLITAQERLETETVDVDLKRFDTRIKHVKEKKTEEETEAEIEKEDRAETENEEEEVKDDFEEKEEVEDEKESEVEEESETKRDPEKEKRKLPSSSMGRKRFKPDRFES